MTFEERIRETFAKTLLQEGDDEAKITARLPSASTFASLVANDPDIETRLTVGVVALFELTSSLFDELEELKIQLEDLQHTTRDREFEELDFEE